MSIMDRIKKHPAFESIHDEGRSMAFDERGRDHDWWCHLKPGWRTEDDTISIHSPTLTDVLARLRSCRQALQ